MPDLPTPQAYLEQSALLLQAYPDSVGYPELILFIQISCNENENQEAN